jgi:hypothetical protein
MLFRCGEGECMNEIAGDRFYHLLNPSLLILPAFSFQVKQKTRPAIQDGICPSIVTEPWSSALILLDGHRLAQRIRHKLSRFCECVDSKGRKPEHELNTGGSCLSLPSAHIAATAGGLTLPRLIDESDAGSANDCSESPARKRCLRLSVSSPRPKARFLWTMQAARSADTPIDY